MSHIAVISRNSGIFLFKGSFPLLHQPGCKDEAGGILLDYMYMVQHFDTKHIRIVEMFLQSKQIVCLGQTWCAQLRIRQMN